MSFWFISAGVFSLLIVMIQNEGQHFMSRTKLQWKQQGIMPLVSVSNSPSYWSRARICLQPWFTNAFSLQDNFFFFSQWKWSSYVRACLEQCWHIFLLYSSTAHFNHFKISFQLQVLQKEGYLERIKNGTHVWPSCLKPLNHSIALKSQ